MRLLYNFFISAKCFSIRRSWEEEPLAATWSGVLHTRLSRSQTPKDPTQVQEQAHWRQEWDVTLGGGGGVGHDWEWARDGF